MSATETAPKPTPPAPWHLDVWYDGEQYDAILALSERWGCSLEEAVRRAVARVDAPCSSCGDGPVARQSLQDALQAAVDAL